MPSVSSTSLFGPKIAVLKEGFEMCSGLSLERIGPLLSLEGFFSQCVAREENADTPTHTEGKFEPQGLYKTPKDCRQASETVHHPVHPGRDRLSFKLC